MFNIMNLNNIENIFYWTDNNGAVSLPGDTALTYRTKSDLPRFVAAVYSALNTDSGVSERVVTLNGHYTFSKTSILLATLWIFGAGKMTVNMLLTA